MIKSKLEKSTTEPAGGRKARTLGIDALLQVRGGTTTAPRANNEDKIAG